jgi:L-fuconolactonase
MPQPQSNEWYEQVVEPVLDPDQRIIDPHHHLWPSGGWMTYGLADLRADIRSGHAVERTVFMECHAAYDMTQPDWLRSVGETTFITAEAAQDPDHVIGGIVAHTDLSDREHLDEALDAHGAASGGLFRGIRDIGASALYPDTLMIPGRARPGLYGEPDFRAGVARSKIIDV